ncbi:MAG: hypothetical protein ABSG81_00965 [Acidimicrobiales bacterium]
MSQDEAADVRDDSAEGSQYPTLSVGTNICVRNRFLGNWTSGFEISEVLDDGYRIRRLSDGHSFPDVFFSEEVRPERRRAPMDGDPRWLRERRR